MGADSVQSGNQIPILSRITCPHCWQVFSPGQTLWIAEHPDLVGDSRLGADAAQRFLPSRFDLRGAALDARGFACNALACPKCHLSVPRSFFEMPPVFFSILGAPACGKSYFLAAMTWRFRKVLPKWFSLSFSDADPILNNRLHEYESMQFLNANQDQMVAIEKTEVQGDSYDTVLYGDQRISYPRPFVFSVAPMEGHPNYAASARAARTLCVYDNAGESFLPGADSASSPVTRHLALSRVMMFLFDPTQDMRFRKLCAGRTNDPQMAERSERLDRERPVRQETILAEAAQRVRRFTGLGQNQKHPRPLIVVITKLDAWSSLVKIDGGWRGPWMRNCDGSMSAMQLDRIDELSQLLRTLLWKVSPEIVSVAESFASQVLYVPVSATGCSPERDPRTGAFGFRPKNVKPIWAEVPMLCGISRWMQGLIPYKNPTVYVNKPAEPNHDARWAEDLNVEPLLANRSEDGEERKVAS